LHKKANIAPGDHTSIQKDKFMRKRRLVIFIATSILMLGLVFFGRVSPFVQSSLLNRNSFTTPSTYDPSYYGLPPTIAGYKTFAVLTSDNTACMMPGEKRLVVQASQATVQGFLSEGDYTAIQNDLQQHGFGDFAQGNMEIVGPGTTLDQFLSENEKWNKAGKEYGCVTSAPASTFPNP
jgi:hypothetical protein